MFPKTDISKGWGSFGTEGGAPASFFKRYYQPLLRYGRHKFGLDESTAEELVSAYMLRELQRERDRDPAIFRLYDPNKGRFRSLLAWSTTNLLQHRVASPENVTFYTVIAC